MAGSLSAGPIVENRCDREETVNLSIDFESWFILVLLTALLGSFARSV
jgi:hypothetical protein